VRTEDAEPEPLYAFIWVSDNGVTVGFDTGLMPLIMFCDPTLFEDPVHVLHAWRLVVWAHCTELRPEEFPDLAL